MARVGEPVPRGTLKVKQQDGTVANVPTDDLFRGKKIVVVGVPGAFTSTCHNSHIPRFVANAAAIKARGIDRIVVLAVNDHHVMKAWADVLDPEAALAFFADGNGDYSKMLGLDVDLSDRGLGVRCQRFAMIVDDGAIEYMAVEETTGQITGSSAAAVLDAL
jgi:peroxiredoxin